MLTKRFQRLNSNRKLNFARLLPIRQKCRALCFRLFILVTFLLLAFMLILLLWRNLLHVPCPLTNCSSLTDCPLTTCPVTDCPDTKPPMSLAQTPSTSRPPSPSRCPNNSMFNFSSVVRFSNIHLPFVVKVPLGARTFPCAGRSVLGVVLVMSRRNAAVCREDRYVSEKHFPGKMYPHYMQGATYFGTAQAVRAVMAQPSEVVGFSVDDVIYTGILAEHVKPPVVRFQTGRAHFRGEQKIMPQNEQCEKGVPFIFAAFSGLLTPRFKSVEDYKRTYKQIHTAKCKSSAANESKLLYLKMLSENLLTNVSKFKI